MPRRVVVTGIGAVSAAGWGVGPLLEALRSGRPLAGSITRFDASRHRTRIAAEVPPAPAAVAAAIPGWRRLSRSDRYAVAAAREALVRAGRFPRGSGPEMGVFFGTSTAGMPECERFHERLQAGAFAPVALLRSQEANGPGDAVARDVGAAGPVESVSSACSSGALALRAALEAIRDGEAAVALAGGSDALCELTHAGFNALRSVDAAPCRPFEEQRAGLTIGEGAAVLVLESEDEAERRGAPVLAEVLGAGASCDAHHMTAPHPQGAGAARAIRAALFDALRDPGDVTWINAHATATPQNELSEWKAIEDVFGARAAAIPVVATKSLTGHLLGAAGAIEALATVDSLVTGMLHPAPEGGLIDPRAPAALVRGGALRLGDVGGRSWVALSTSLAFGGSNAAVLFGAAARAAGV